MTGGAPVRVSDAIADLASHGERFVCWRWRTRGGRRTKPPVTPDGTYADSTDPTSWCGLEEALHGAERPDIDGIGFVLDAARDGIVGVDLDGCRDPDTGEIRPWAARIIRTMRSYTEVSPSGTGVKILVKADPVPRLAANKRVVKPANGTKAEQVEVYASGRYFCLTGQVLDGVPDEVVDATPELERLVAWIGGAKPRADLPAEFVALLEHDRGLRDAWTDGGKIGPGTDTTASGLEFSLAVYLRPHLEDDDLVAVLRSYKFGQVGSGALKGVAADRRLERILAELGPRGSTAGNHDGNSFDQELAELARMGAADYDRVRKARAKEIGVRTETLDKLVAQSRSEAPEAGIGRGLEWPDPDPWPEPVDGAALLEELAATFRSHVALPPACDIALALWVLHAHAFGASPITPRLAITSPEKRCGKTTTLEVVQALVPRPILASNITAAAVFRTIELARPTLLIDEADSFLAEAEELRGVLNSGHRRTGEVIRTVGEAHEPRRFSTWAPVAIAAIGGIPGTLDDRSIKVELRRRGAGEQVERWRVDRAHRLEPLVRRCARWAADHLEGLRDADPDVPAQLHDRAADNWRPLLAIADLAGGEWPVRVRAAAVALSAGGEAQGRREMLLADVRTVFAERGNPKWIRTEEILEALVKMAERPWAEASRGRPISPQALRSLLEPFKVFSSSDGKSRGFKREAFADAWDRYLLPADAAGSGDPSIRREPGNDAGSEAPAIRQPESDPDGCGPRPNPHGHWSADGSTDRSPGTDVEGEFWL